MITRLTYISGQNVDEPEAGKTLVGAGDIGCISLEAIVENLWKCYKAKTTKLHNQSIDRDAALCSTHLKVKIATKKLSMTRKRRILK